jgi:hypothetical protein
VSTRLPAGVADGDPFALHEIDWDAPCRIYLTSDASVFALVDFEDYQWALRWRWSVSLSNKHSGLRRKRYTARAACRRVAGEATYTKVYLHREVLLRAAGPPPPGKPVADHINGDSLDCRRSNLRWVSASENRRTARRHR